MENNQDFFGDIKGSFSYENIVDDYGYEQVVKQREENRNRLRKQLYKLYLTDKEIDELFKIIIDTEKKMDKIKSKIDFKNCVAGEVTKMNLDMIEAQENMKVSFEKELKKVIQKKYELAKKILKQNGK